MAKQKNSSLGVFAGFVVGTIAVGYVLGLVSIWAYNAYLKNISLGFGEGILLLGGLAGLIYTVMGAAIAFAYFKHIRE